MLEANSTPALNASGPETPAVGSASQSRIPASAPTPLADAMGALASLQLAEYRGAITAAEFSETVSELSALLNGACVYDLGWRSFLRCEGEDCVRWLNGMVTNSVVGLSTNQGCYAFVLNAQGRIQGDLYIYRGADALWLQTDASQLGTLAAYLERYIIMDDVILQHAEEWTAVGIAGPQAANILGLAGFPIPPAGAMQMENTLWGGLRVMAIGGYSPLVPRYEIWCKPKDVLQVWNALTASGVARCGAKAVEQLRILEGTPAYSIDITDRDLPQETGQTRALHFSKGCYLGQEIVERIRSRGNVHRNFSGFLVQNNCQLPKPNPRIPLLAENKSVGELSSVGSISFPDGTERVLALGTIRREALDRKLELNAVGCAITPASLPFDFKPSAIQP
ncbi:MAG TPA: folate-binding protein [Acidobacteriaceae bacterium]|nr:folate-binding protein [Acidobacteriaceae bacterium]